MGKDARFINVTIDVLHTGGNLNGSRFEKEVVDRAAKSIANTPILGYIEQNDDDELDFKGHEHELIVDEDGIKYVYAGSAYGVIPESCNPRWVSRDDGTGKTREYLRVDGLLWTKFDDSCEIFERDVVKGQSMEITNMEGYVDKDGYYVVQNFDFDGCCVLSTTDPQIRPAMTGSTVTANFTAATIASQVKDMLAEYTALQRSESSKEAQIDNFAKGDDCLKEKEEILASYGIDASTLEFSLEEITIEELKAKCEEMAAAKPAEPEEPQGEPESEPAAEPAAEPVEPEAPADPEPAGEPEGGEPAADYSLNLCDKLNEVSEAVSAETMVDPWGYEVSRYWLQDVQDDLAVVMDCQDWKIYSFVFTMDGDNVKVDFASKKRMKVKYEAWDEGSADIGMPALYTEIGNKAKEQTDKLEAANKQYSELKAEYDEMKPKYDAYVAAEAAAAKEEESAKREQLFAVMDQKLDGDADYAKLRDNKTMEFTVLEDACYKLLGKKAAEFSYVPPKENKGEVNKVRFGVNGTQKTEKRYGDLFERYLKNTEE